MAELLTPLTKGQHLDDPYVVAGDRAYLIGAQNGGFPDHGHHVPGEMWGLWAHPHKLLDGYWCALRAEDHREATWLIAAAACEVAATSVTHIYDCPELAVRVRRRQWVPEGHTGLIVEMAIESTGGLARPVEVSFLCRTDLRPGWLQEAPDGDDLCSFRADAGACVAEDRLSGWAVAWGSQSDPIAGEAGVGTYGPVETATAGHGCAGVLRYTVQLPPTGVTRLLWGIYGADGSDGALAGLADLLAGAEALWQAKEEAYGELLQRTRLDVPDPILMEAWDWVKCNYAWLIREVPGIGRGLGAGLPEYPWWFGCDTSYALRGLLPLGDFATATASLRLLATVSERHNGGSGQIIHELSGSGVVFNEGNTQETPQFTCAVYETYLWTGDEALLRDLYPLCRRGVLEWTLGTQDTDHDMLPEGYGIIEVAGLNNELIDSAVWTAVALRSLEQMARRLGDEETAGRCARLAPRVRQTLLERFWLPDEGMFGDVIATPRQLLERLSSMESQPEYQAQPSMLAYVRQAAERAATLPPDEEVTWYFGNWVVLAPLEYGLASLEQAERAFARLESAQFSGPHGVYLSAITQTAAMSISTGALAAAECCYGRIEQAVAAARQIGSSLHLHMPGAISEMSPDGGCFVQAWSGYGIVYPLAGGVFGLQPDAARRHLRLCPRLPSGWDHAALTRVRIGMAWLDIDLRRDDEGMTICSLSFDQPGWSVGLDAPSGQRVLAQTVDGADRPAAGGHEVMLTATYTARLGPA